MKEKQTFSPTLMEKIKVSVLAALDALAERGEKIPVHLKVKDPGATSNQALMEKLLRMGKNEDEILAVFLRRYALRGKGRKSQAWVAKRVKIYERIARAHEAIGNDKKKRARNRRSA